MEETEMSYNYDGGTYFEVDQKDEDRQVSRYLLEHLEV